MSWAQLTNQPNNNGSQRYNNYNNNNNNNYRKSNNYRIRTNNHYNNNKPPRLQKQKVETTNSKRKHNDINYVILDSGAFIGRQSFFNNFNSNVRYFMTQAVNNEIRDKQSRQFLDNFPYEIIVKQPDPQSVAFGMI